MPSTSTVIDVGEDEAWSIDIQEEGDGYRVTVEGPNQQQIENALANLDFVQRTLRKQIHGVKKS